MRKIPYILLIAIIFASCAPQKRLSRFLQHHPELQTTRVVEIHDTVVVHDTIIQQPDTNTLNLTLNQILKLDSAANADHSITDSPSCTERVETNGSAAELKALGNGKFQLNTITKPDTIIIHDTVPVKGEAEVPQYTTEIKEVPVIVHEQTWWQKSLCWLGAALLAWLLIKLGMFIAKKWIKPV